VVIKLTVDDLSEIRYFSLKGGYCATPSEVTGTSGSQGLSPANDVKQDDHNGDNQKNMNETAHGVGRDEPQEP
jgi:hypothetical protein